MNQLIYIKPKEGMTIPHPDTGKAIDADGASVPNNKFYRGFLAREEAVKGNPPKPEKPSATPDKNTAKK